MCIRDSFLSIECIDYLFFPLPPEIVQLIEQEFKLTLRQLSLSFHDKILPKVVDLSGHPETALRDELLVTGAEVDLLVLLVSIETRFLEQIGLPQELNSIVHQGKF